MTRSWLLFGVALQALLMLLIVPYIFQIPFGVLLDGDAADYTRAAENLAGHLQYSVDGVQPFFSREPGYSAFLALIYTFSPYRILPVFIVQAVLLTLSAWAIAVAIRPAFGNRTAFLTFLLLVTSGNALHAVFSLYRESLALVLCLLLSALLLEQARKNRPWHGAALGLVLGSLILTYYTFIFLPFALLLLWTIERRSLRSSAQVIAITLLIVSAWALRNWAVGGPLAIIEDRRPAVMWYVRGEQAERIRGLEGFRCLWSEYISRDWEGRSSACSFNALMHERWPEGAHRASLADLALAKEQGISKILSHFPSYLWFSAMEVLELHLPYVGGGWSRAFHLYIATTTLLLLGGSVLGAPLLFDRRFRPLFILMAYNILVFALTDAIPRYHVPVLGSYAVLAAIGYNRLLGHRFRS